MLHIYHDFWPTRGGIEDVLDDLTRAQAARGDEPIVLCANDSPRTREERRGAVRVIRAAAFARYYTPFCPSWPARIRQLQPELVHLHLPCPLGEWAVWLARPRRLIVSLHNDYVRPQFALRLHRPLHRALLRRAQAIIVATPDYARTSPVLDELQTKVSIVPYGLSPITYRISSETLHASRITLDVLFAGRLCYYKGVEVLLAAAPAINARITIIGDGPWRERLQAQAQRAQLGERVDFRGAVDEETMLAQMRASDVFTFPSTERSEAFGIAQLKAMACGLPVVSTNLPGVSWLNRHGETGLTVPKRDANALASAVNRLLDDAPLRARLAAGARMRA
ncbi:MAG: glycosyltransferase, partial [Chloroflexota bacterium]